MPKPIQNLKKVSQLEWKDQGGPAGAPHFFIADVWARKDPDSDTHPDFRHVDIEAYKLDPGAFSEAHFHKDHFELVMVWSGSGLLRRGTAENGFKPSDHDIKALDTFTIPRGTLHRFEAKGAEPLILITAHALNGMKLETQPGQFAAQPAPTGLDIRNVQTTANAPENWETDPHFRAKRIRMWGREAPRGEAGGVDAIKEQLQFTLYTFVPGQQNPGHFHPHSVEFICAVTGRVDTSIRRKLAEPAIGWETADQQQEGTLQPGDLVLVPLAGWHRYINNHPQDRSMVMAMQTPHPIMHTLLDETNGAFDPTAIPA